ncbi:nucleotidyltransferase domain-containing protein [Niallia sp. 01092]|uniref:nucleotidyltransferase domain-containing protein n=1 Tax=unclassified Niallia TaxID=2837522 RepID=UPI003FD2D257
MGVEVERRISEFTLELQLLVSLLKLVDSQEDIPRIKEQYSAVDWDKFLQLAIHHRVYPSIYKKLSNMDNDWIPSHVLQTLRNKYQFNTFQMLQLSAEMGHVIKQLSARNIPSLVLKGPILAADLYGDISLRTSKDLDILIPFEHLESAHEILRMEGYISDEYPIILKEWKWKTHHFSYTHSQKKINIELHWRLHNPPDKEPSFHSLWERKRVSRLTDFPIYYLGNEDMYLYLITHGARHGWFRLRWLQDIDRISRQEFDWKLLNQLIKINKYQLLVGQAVMLASLLFNTPKQQDLRFVSYNKSVSSITKHALSFITNSGKYHLAPEAIEDDLKIYAFSLQPGFMQKMKYILVRLYPTHIDAETLPLPKGLHFLYFPLRPVLWILRKKTSI